MIILLTVIAIELAVLILAVLYEKKADQPAPVPQLPQEQAAMQSPKHIRLRDGSWVREGTQAHIQAVKRGKVDA